MCRVSSHYYQEEQPRADGALVVRRPLAALREQHQLISRGHALAAPPQTFPKTPLLAAEGCPRQLPPTRTADLHHELAPKQKGVSRGALANNRRRVDATTPKTGLRE